MEMGGKMKFNYNKHCLSCRKEKCFCLDCDGECKCGRHLDVISGNCGFCGNSTNVIHFMDIFSSEVNLCQECLIKLEENLVSIEFSRIDFSKWKKIDGPMEF